MEYGAQGTRKKRKRDEQERVNFLIEAIKDVLPFWDFGDGV